MNLYIENDKLYKKGLFNNQVIEADSIDRIEVDSGVSTVYLKSGKKLTSQSALNWLFENASFYEKNNVSYDDKTYEGQTYTYNQLREKLENVKNKAYNIASKIVKDKLGKNFDIEAKIVGDLEYSILVFKLIENGVVLDDHDLYANIGELGVDRAIDEIDLSFLVKWDSYSREGFYGVTEEVEDEDDLFDYIDEYFSNITSQE